jgi:hypothetical protein
MTEPTPENIDKCCTPASSENLMRVMDAYAQLTSQDRRVFWHVACNLIKASGLGASQVPIEAWASAIVTYEDSMKTKLPNPQEEK